MTKHFCDMCGIELNIDENLINLNFNCFKNSQAKLTEKTNGIKPEFDLCVECAYSVYRIIKFKKKRVPDDIEDKDGRPKKQLPNAFEELLITIMKNSSKEKRPQVLQSHIQKYGPLSNEAGDIIKKLIEDGEQDGDRVQINSKP